MDQETVSFIVNCLLMFIVYKLGQFSVIHRANIHANKSRIEPVPVVFRKIDIEEIDGIYYAYDGNDFLAQGNTPDELGASIAKRFPNKYRRAKIEVKS